jgi:hypothetical protein
MLLLLASHLQGMRHRPNPYKRFLPAVLLQQAVNSSAAVARYHAVLQPLTSRACVTGQVANTPSCALPRNSASLAAAGALVWGGLLSGWAVEAAG